MEATLSRRSLLLAALARAAAQEVKFSTSVDVVTLLATVRNGDGGIVNDLNQDDFVLEEDGRPQTIRYFSRESDLPLVLALLVDTSQSMRPMFEAERAASVRFLDRILREDRDVAAVVHFDVKVGVLQEFTSSRQKLAAALDGLEIPPRRLVGTRLYDSIRKTSEELMRSQSGRKAFILLSDGLDFRDPASIVTAIEYAQRADTLIYSIWLHGKTPLGAIVAAPTVAPITIGGYAISLAKGKATMQRLSGETGGGFFEVTKHQSIESIYSQIEEELRNQYSLGYTSDHPGNDKQYRKITLTTERPKLIVQTRAGYYPR
jgi:VWFA-related protein